MQIQEYLKEIEQECHVRALFAVESGSRAWGIDSQDSDYDCRFIKLHARTRLVRVHRVS